MELAEVMTKAGQTRFFSSEAVTDADLQELVGLARFGPSGGNRQPVRFVAVRDPEVKRRLRDLYLQSWNGYLDRIAGGRLHTENASKAVRAADDFAHRLHEVPALVMVCARMADLHVTDANLDRISIVGGASVYPIVQNFLLAARDRGLGTSITTLLCESEPEVRPLLRIPDEFGLAATIALGRPAAELPSKLRRLPVSELLFAERFGSPLGRS